MKTLTKLSCAFALLLSSVTLSVADAVTPSAEVTLSATTKQEGKCTVSIHVGFLGIFGAKVSATADTCAEAWAILRGKKAETPPAQDTPVEDCD